MTDLQLGFVEEAARLVQQQVSPEVAGQLQQLVDNLHRLAAPRAAREFTLASLICEDHVEIHPSLAGPWLGEVETWRALLAEARRLGDSLTLTTCTFEGSVRLVVNGYRPEASVSALALRFQVERLGGRVFASEAALALTLPLSRPQGFTADRNAAAVPVAGGLANASASAGPAVGRGDGAGLAAREQNASAGATVENWAAHNGSATTGSARISASPRRVLDQLAGSGDQAGVVRAAEEVLAASPDCVHALQHLALAHVRRQDWTRAFPVMRRLAGRYFATDDFDSARALLRQMLSELPDPQTGLQLAEDCLVQGELGLAESYFRAAADQLVRARDLRGAVGALRRLQLVKPGDLDLAQSLGELLGRLGEHQEAVAVFRTILRVRPSHRGALGALDELARLTADVELAELVRRRLLRPVSKAV